MTKTRYVGEFLLCLLMSSLLILFAFKGGQAIHNNEHPVLFQVIAFLQYPGYVLIASIAAPGMSQRTGIFLIEAANVVIYAALLFGIRGLLGILCGYLNAEGRVAHPPS